MRNVKPWTGSLRRRRREFASSGFTPHTPGNRVLGYEKACYIGDDINNISLLRKVNFSVAVNDAPENVKSEVSSVSNKPGGKGVVREIIEYILKSKGIFNSPIEDMVKDCSA